MAQTAKAAGPTTSNQNKHLSFRPGFFSTSAVARSQFGFTLIEIMIVLGIIALVTAVGIPAVSSITYQRVASSTRKFVGTMRSIRNDSILLNKVHRLVVDLDENSWWVETQSAFRLIRENEEEELEKERKKKLKSEGPVDTNFSANTKYGSKPNQLPSGVVFNGVLKEREGYLDKGIAYVYFFPSGYADQAVVYLNKEGVATGGYSVIMRPASGKVDIYNKRVKSFDEVVDAK